MAAKCTTSAMGLPTLKPRCVYLTSSVTPGQASSMAPNVAGTVVTGGLNTDGTRTATFTSTLPHGLLVGAAVTVTVSGAAHAGLNITALATPTSDTVFTYTVPGAVGSVAGDAANATYRCQYQSIVIMSDSANNATQANWVSFGPNQNADFYSVGPGASYSDDAPSGAKLDLADIFFKSAVASQNIRVYVK